MKILILMDMPLFPYRIYAYNGLVDRGYDLTVVSMSNQETTYDIKLKFKHTRLPFVKIGPFDWMKGYGEIIMDEYDYIIITPNLRVLNFFPLYGDKYKEKLLAWGHLKGCTSGNKLAAAIRLRMCKKIKSIIFYEAGTKDDFIKAGFNPEQLFVANNTQYVDLDTVDLMADRRYFLYVGRIQERKAIDFALCAFAQISKQYPNIGFKVVGGGDSTHLKTLCAELGIKSAVEFTGPIHDEQKLADAFNHAVAYVSPGHVGLGVLHSLAFGVPVITCSGRLHSVEISNCKSENSFVVPFNPTDIAAAMKNLCRDENLRKQKSIAAHEYYKEYCTIDKMVDGLDDAIKYMISNK